MSVAGAARLRARFCIGYRTATIRERLAWLTSSKLIVDRRLTKPAVEPFVLSRQVGLAGQQPEASSWWELNWVR